MKSYCYVGRYNDSKVFVNENTNAILRSIFDWVLTKQWPKVPNQCDDKYYVIDIGCSTDVALHGKYYDWQKVFNFFNDHPYLKSTFATKYPSRLRDYDLNKEKHRIRVSLMPQIFSDVLEPNTDSIDTRIDMIPKLQEKMEVHINFSPIVYHDNWLEHYKELFEKMKGLDFKSECIFLTYNKVQFIKNSETVNDICWKPDIQEAKDSQYAADNIRYKYNLKCKMVDQFKDLYSKYFDLSTIRYIF
jgi:spore photoproduct lyase